MKNYLAPVFWKVPLSCRPGVLLQGKRTRRLSIHCVVVVVVDDATEAAIWPVYENVTVFVCIFALVCVCVCMKTSARRPITKNKYWNLFRRRVVDDWERTRVYTRIMYNAYTHINQKIASKCFWNFFICITIIILCT